MIVVRHFLQDNSDSKSLIIFTFIIILSKYIKISYVIFYYQQLLRQLRDQVDGLPASDSSLDEDLDLYEA